MFRQKYRAVYIKTERPWHPGMDDIEDTEMRVTDDNVNMYHPLSVDKIEPIPFLGQTWNNATVVSTEIREIDNRWLDNLSQDNERKIKRLSDIYKQELEILNLQKMIIEKIKEG